MNDYVNEIHNIPLLSDEETLSLIFQMKDGNKSARDKLITHNLRVVLKIAYKYSKLIDLAIDELISIGSLGVIKAVDKYDADKNIKLITLIYPCVENEFKKYIYLSKMQKNDRSNEISMQTEIYQNKDGEGITIEDSLEDDEISIDELIDTKIRSEKVKKILEKLTKEEREILLLRYGIIDDQAHTLQEIANIKGVSKETVRLQENRAIKKLKHPKITKQIKDFFEE